MNSRIVREAVARYFERRALMERLNWIDGRLDTLLSVMTEQEFLEYQKRTSQRKGK